MRLVERDLDSLLLAEAGGRIVGSLIVAWDGWRGSFYRLAVHPDWRRRGVATALIRAGPRRKTDLESQASLSAGWRANIGVRRSKIASMTLRQKMLHWTGDMTSLHFVSYLSPMVLNPRSVTKSILAL